MGIKVPVDSNWQEITSEATFSVQVISNNAAEFLVAGSTPAPTDFGLWVQTAQVINQDNITGIGNLYVRTCNGASKPSEVVVLT